MSAATNQRISLGRIGLKAGLMAGVLAFTVLAAATASAQSVGPDISVRYSDLNINTVAGAEKLYERIQQAAAQVCPAADSKWLAEYVAVVRCRNQVVAHAVNSISSPQVTAVFTARAHHGVRSPV